MAPSVFIFIVFAALTWRPLFRFGEWCAASLYDWGRGRLMNKVKLIRIARGWTCEELARRAGVSKVTIHNLESEPRPYMASRFIVEAVAEALALEPADLAYLMLPHEWVPEAMKELDSKMLQTPEPV